jgi:hypothetical protein
MRNKSIIVLILFSVFFVSFSFFYKNIKNIKNKTILQEPFYPAWNDFMVYSQLSRRLKIGGTASAVPRWLQDNPAINGDTLFFDTERDAIHHLLVTKKVDVIVVSEAQYGMFILSQLPREAAGTRAQIVAHKHVLLQNSSARRLLSLGPVHHLLVANNLTQRPTKPKPIEKKQKKIIVQIAHLTDDMQLLEKAVLKNVPCRFMHTDTPDVSHQRSDAYFYDHYEYSAQFFQNTLYNNSTVWDCPESLPDKYFFFQKDNFTRLPTYYPHLAQRRIGSGSVQCFSSQLLLLTRGDVPVEWIHLFVQSVLQQQPKLSHPFTTKSILQDFVPLHPTLL